MTLKSFSSGALGVAMALAIAVPAFAQTSSPKAGPNGYAWGQRGDRQGMGVGAMKPGIIGTVSSVNGTTITVAGHEFGPNMMKQATTTYMVDASGATVVKNDATSSVSAISSGDTVFVIGTISGSNVVATSIRDGMIMRGRFGPGGPGKGPDMGGFASSTMPISGNGQPVVAGTVSSMNGSTVTITTSSNVTYTIDASNAKVVKGPAAATLANVAVGDFVVVQGSVNGTSVTASSIIDGRGPGGNGNSSAGEGNGDHGEGIFGAIGSFFKHLFGF